MLGRHYNSPLWLLACRWLEAAHTQRASELCERSPCQSSGTACCSRRRRRALHNNNDSPAAKRRWRRRSCRCECHCVAVAAVDERACSLILSPPVASAALVGRCKLAQASGVAAAATAAVAVRAARSAAAMRLARCSVALASVGNTIRASEPLSALGAAL